MRDRNSERIEFLDVSGSTNNHLIDLSKTGVCCLYRKMLKPGVFVSVDVQGLKLKAKVIYSQERTDGSRCGLEFCSPTPEQQQTINDLVEKFSRGVPLQCSIVEVLDK